jgi:hypothetical protein
MQLLGEEERRLDVERHHLVPPALGKAGERGAPRRPGVVDQNVEPVLAPGDLLRQRRHPGERRDVARQRHALPPQFAGGGVDRGRRARGHVNPFASRREEALGDHPPDPARAAGDQRDASLEAEQVRAIHRALLLGGFILAETCLGRRRSV